MRLPKPKFMHPSEIYTAIINEHRDNPVRMAERLQGFGWAMADAAWVAVHRDLTWLAAAIANERAARPETHQLFRRRPRQAEEGDRRRAEASRLHRAKENAPDSPNDPQAHATVIKEARGTEGII